MNFYYITAILITIIAILIQNNLTNKKTNKVANTKKIQWVNGICTVLVMVLTYVTSNQEGAESEKSLNRTITEQSNKILSLNNQIKVLSQTSADNTNQMIGNGSHPFGFIGGGRENAIQICIQAKGQYAIPNVTATFIILPNYKKIHSLDLKTTGFTDPNIRPINLGTIKTGDFQSIFVETKTQDTAVRIIFKSDNHSWIQDIRIVQTPNLRTAFWFITDETGKIIDKYIEPNFPKTKDSKLIIWSNVIKSFGEL